MKFPNPFRKKKKPAAIPPETVPPTRLPEELETFRVGPTPIPGPAGEPRFREYPTAPPIGPRPIERPAPKPEERPGDRIEMILQKLETIDARLKLIEERLRR